MSLLLNIISPSAAKQSFTVWWMTQNIMPCLYSSYGRAITLIKIFTLLHMIGLRLEFDRLHELIWQVVADLLHKTVEINGISKAALPLSQNNFQVRYRLQGSTHCRNVYSTRYCCTVILWLYSQKIATRTKFVPRLYHLSIVYDKGLWTQLCLLYFCSHSQHFVLNAFSYIFFIEKGFMVMFIDSTTQQCYFFSILYKGKIHLYNRSLNISLDSVCLWARLYLPFWLSHPTDQQPVLRLVHTMSHTES